MNFCLQKHGILYRIMKNIELFKTIEGLVQSKAQTPATQTNSFAHRYCKQQIQKKKLVPHNPNSKMNQIMKNFYQLDTYINVQKLFDYINTIINEKKREDIRTENQIQLKSKQLISLNANNEDIVEKVKEKLGDFYQERHMKQNQSAWKLLETLQADTTVTGQLKKNTSERIQYESLLKSINQNKDEKNRRIMKSNWKYYERSYDYQENIKKQSMIPTRLQRISAVQGNLIKRQQKSNLKQRQERKQLIHQVGTYLQIILENKHKKKWGKNYHNKLKSKIERDQKEKSNQTNSSSYNQNSHNNTNDNIDEHSQNTQQKISQHKIQTFFNSSKGLSLQRRTVHKSNFDEQLPITFRRQVSLLNQTSKDTYISNQSRSMNVSPGPLSLSRKSSSKKKEVKDHFTFRNRNIKQKLMKKLETFLDLVETEEKQFKKQKNNEINEINQLELKYKNNYNRIFGNSIVAEDHQIRAVRNKVHQQK